MHLSALASATVRSGPSSSAMCATRTGYHPGKRHPRKCCRRARPAELGLGAAGYGYLLAAVGAGGALAAGVANRAAGSDSPRRALIASMIAVGAPLPALAVVNWLPAAILLAALFGAGCLFSTPW
jgi:hypothetical protein